MNPHLYKKRKGGPPAYLGFTRSRFAAQSRPGTQTASTLLGGRVMTTDTKGALLHLGAVLAQA